MSLLLESATAIARPRVAPEWRGCADRIAFLGATSPRARFHMRLTWSMLAGLFAVVAVWLSISHVRFAASNWNEIGRLIGLVGLALAFCGVVTTRLRHDPSRIACVLRAVATRIGLTAGGALLLSLVTSLVVVFCCLASSAALPFRDAELAGLDAAIGFDWPAFVAAVNASPLASLMLVKAYQSTAYMLCGTVLWLGLTGQTARLCEFLALLCVTSAGVAVGMLLLPAEGAYAHYRPAAAIFSQFSSNAGMWHHDLLMTFRTAAAPVIDFTTPNINCLVTFPSGHTVLGIVITYALRKSLWTLVPAVLMNGAMIVSTLPEGGHHLVDLIGGAAIASAAIAVTRWPLPLVRQDAADDAEQIGFAKRLA